MFIRSFHDEFCWIEVDVMNLLHVCMIHLSRKPAVVQSFLRNNKLHQHTYPACCGVKRVADTFVEVSLVFGFLLLADANTADRTLCKYL